MNNIILGMDVWSLVHGQGTVKSYNGEIIVCDFYGIDVEFTAQGRMVKYRNENQVLYFSEPVVTGLTKPPFAPIFKDGEMVIASKHQDGYKGEVIKVSSEDEEGIVLENGKKYFKNDWFFFKVGQEVVMS